MNRPLEDRVYFSGFDGVRGLAVLGVIIHHVEQFKFDMKLPSHWESPIIKGLGHYGVDVFFVLSGFLITYLLLTEIKRIGTISLRDFYARRALRILPLYALIAVCGFTFFPHLIAGTGGAVGTYAAAQIELRDRFYAPSALLYFLMLPNVALLLYPPVFLIAQCWSIGVEEQFYLIWPLMLKFGGRRKWVPMLLAIIAKLGFQAVLALFASGNGLPARLLEGLTGLSLESLAIGGLFACLLFENPDWVNRHLVNGLTRALAAPGLVLLLVFGSFLPFSEVSAPILCGWLLLSLPGNPYPIVNLEIPWLKRLGRISYGVYLFQGLGLAIAFRLAEAGSLFRSPAWLLESFLLTATLFVTYLIAGVSYRHFEKFFLNLKHRYSIVQSGGKADV